MQQIQESTFVIISDGIVKKGFVSISGCYDFPKYTIKEIKID